MNNISRLRRGVCEKCAATCERCLELFSLGESQREGSRDVFEACARMCALAADEIEIDSAYRAQVCTICVLLCRACGEECRQLRGALFAQCADACENAARACFEAARQT